MSSAQRIVLWLARNTDSLYGEVYASQPTRTTVPLEQADYEPSCTCEHCAVIRNAGEIVHYEGESLYDPCVGGLNDAGIQIAPGQMFKMAITLYPVLDDCGCNKAAPTSTQEG